MKRNKTRDTGSSSIVNGQQDTIKKNSLYKVLSNIILISITYFFLKINALAEEEVSYSKEDSGKIIYTSGTGFYIDNTHIITNQHVVNSCRNIKVRGNASDSENAEIIGNDYKNDLAIIKTSASRLQFASLRKDSMVDIGEEVTVIGYPREYGISGKSLVKKAQVLNYGLDHGIKRIEFTDSVDKGNSGGPLLDKSGSVIGVISGRINYYLADPDTGHIIDKKPVKIESVAVGIDALKQLLEKYNIFYTENISNKSKKPQQAEELANSFIVNIHCMK